MNTCKTKEECIRTICELPFIYHDELNISEVEIARKSGYERFRKDIRRQDIIDMLKQNKDLVTKWLEWTADKRCSPSWGVEERNKHYILFYMVSSGEIEISQIFDNPYDACAILIRLEMDTLILIQPRK